MIRPREALDRLQANEGDSLLLTETSEGIMLTAADAEFKKKMAMVEGIMRR